MCGSSSGGGFFLYSVIVVLVCFGGSASAATCFIDAQAGNDSTGSGSSASPWASFFQAISSGCDDVRARPGLYSGPTNRDVMVVSPVNITGTGGVNVVDDGPDEGAIVDLQGQGRFVLASAPLRITRLTIREGVAALEGGAIQSSSSIHLELCSVHHNNISGAPLAAGILRGGAIVASQLSAIHSSFRENRIDRESTGSITAQGGALAADTVQLYNCSLRFNSISSSGAGTTVARGAALAISKQTTTSFLLLQNSLFYSNVLVGGGLGPNLGGAVYFENPVDSPNRVSLQLQRNLFLSNQITASSGTRLGGALYSEEGDLDSVIQNLFFDNFAADSGGALYINQVSIDRPSGVSGASNQFVNNTAGSSAADIFDGGTVGIMFSAISSFQCGVGSPVIVSGVGCTGCDVQGVGNTDGDSICNSGDCAPLMAALQVPDTTGSCIALSALDTDTGLAPAPALQGMVSLSFFFARSHSVGGEERTWTGFSKNTKIYI